MNVRLTEVNRDNWRECIRLKPSEDQMNFVAPNLYSLAESRFDVQMKPTAIYHDDEMVGFIMYGFDPDDGSYVVQRLMIDAAQQGKGYGRAAMVEAIKRMREEPDCRQIALSYVPGNAAAAKLYESLGFVKTGEIIDGEEVVRLRFDE